MNNNASMRASPVPLIVIALIAYWTGTVVAMHLLEPEFDPIAVPMSVYVVGAYGVWMTVSFFVAAVIWFLLALGLARILPPTLWSKAGVVLFCIAGCGEIVMGFNPTQWPLTPPVATHTVVHLFGGLVAFYAIALGSISFSVSFRRAEHWRAVSTLAIVISLLMFALLNYRWLWRPGSSIDGLMQRVIVVLMLLWAVPVLSRWMRWSPNVAPAIGPQETSVL